MCDWGTEVVLSVPIPANCSHTGKFRWDVKGIDSCLAPYIKALNDAGLYTGGCCCGHGKENGHIAFHDGTVFTIHKVDPETMPCTNELEAA